MLEKNAFSIQKISSTQSKHLPNNWMVNNQELCKSHIVSYLWLYQVQRWPTFSLTRLHACIFHKMGVTGFQVNRTAAKRQIRPKWGRRRGWRISQRADNAGLTEARRNKTLWRKTLRYARRRQPRCPEIQQLTYIYTSNSNKQFIFNCINHPGAEVKSASPVQKSMIEQNVGAISQWHWLDATVWKMAAGEGGGKPGADDGRGEGEAGGAPSGSGRWGRGGWGTFWHGPDWGLACGFLVPAVVKPSDAPPGRVHLRVKEQSALITDHSMQTRFIKWWKFFTDK